MHDAIETILIGEREIQERIKELAAEVMEGTGENLIFVILLKGAMVFAADLLRQIPDELEVECIHVSSYYGGVESTGKVKFADDYLPDVRGRRVVVLDDIFDTGLTMQAVAEKFLAAGALSVQSCVLIAKEKPREVCCKPDFVGFTIGDEFVVGYGLDYQEKFRNLPYVGVLKQSEVQQS